MQLVLFACLFGAAFAAFDGCPANSHYDSCGTACPVTCDNYLNPPKICVLMCNPGCHCDEGYVKTEDGRCVLPEQCSSSADEYNCGVNQEYQECGTACPLTCDNYNKPPKACPAICMTGCHCKKGYVLTDDGDCVLPQNCPEFESTSCLLEPEGGMCRGYFPMYYYDAKNMECKKFVYGGCGGNKNRFGSEEQCLEKCGDVQVWELDTNVCDLPIKRGLCLAYMPRYGYNKDTGKCEKFVYGGCQGNGNNFETLEECESRCEVQAALDRPDCDKGADAGLCKAYIPRYYYDQEAGMCKKFIYGGCGGNRNNFASRDECYNKCGALASEGVCSQEKVVGPCRAAFRRFYFNTETNRCEPFIYGGCHGNSNNFLTQEECENVCH